MYVCMYVCTCMHACMHAINIYGYVHKCMHVQLQLDPPPPKHTHSHTPTPIPTHAPTHPHPHTLLSSSGKLLRYSPHNLYTSESLRSALVNFWGTLPIFIRLRPISTVPIMDLGAVITVTMMQHLSSICSLMEFVTSSYQNQQNSTWKYNLHYQIESFVYI